MPDYGYRVTAVGQPDAIVEVGPVDEANALRIDWYGPTRLLDPLPRKTRIRLAVRHRIDKACCWLVERDHDRMAVLIWRCCGMWR